MATCKLLRAEISLCVCLWLYLCYHTNLMCCVELHGFPLLLTKINIISDHPARIPDSAVNELDKGKTEKVQLLAPTVCYIPRLSIFIMFVSYMLWTLSLTKQVNKVQPEAVNLFVFKVLEPVLCILEHIPFTTYTLCITAGHFCVKLYHVTLSQVIPDIPTTHPTKQSIH